MSSKEYKEMEKEEYIRSQEEAYLYDMYLLAEINKIQDAAGRLLDQINNHLESMPNEFRDLEDEKTEEDDFGTEADIAYDNHRDNQD